MVEFRLLGRLELTDSNGRELSTVLAQPKRLALLAFLALPSPGRFHRRDRLLAMLWPDADEPRARRALSQALHFLRASLGAGVLVGRGKEEVALDAREFWCDGAAFEQALEKDDLPDALELYRGDLLDGFFVPDAPEFERWLEEERGRLRRQASGAAAVQAEREGASGKLSSAVRWAHFAVSLQPFEEDALQRLVRLLDRAGDRGSAVRAYEAFAQRLARELELEPSPETQSLVEAVRTRERPRVSFPTVTRVTRDEALDSNDALPTDITVESQSLVESGVPAVAESARRRPLAGDARRLLAFIAVLGGVLAVAWMGWGWRQPDSGETVSAANPIAIAVLPFLNLSADPETDYFSDGISEEILTALGRLEGLRVAARTSSFAFKGINTDIREIGEKLGVAVILEGSVRREGDSVRITVHLVNAADGYRTWSAAHDGAITDVFAIKEDIARAIVRELRLEIPGRGRRALVKRSTGNVTAFDLYLRGRYLLGQRAEARTRKAVEYFEAAIGHDASYALAYAGLAEAYIWLAEYVTPTEALPRAKTAALKALDLDEELAETHLALASVRLIYDRDWPAAEREFRRALDIDPGSAAAHRRYADFLTASRRFDAAMRQTRRALAIERSQSTDVVSSAINENVTLGLAYHFAGRHGEAVERCGQARNLDPGSARARFCVGTAHLARGAYAEALPELEKAHELSDGGLASLTHLGYAYALAGRQDEARKILREVEARAEQGYVPKDQIAKIYIGLGDPDRALQWLERAVEEYHWWLPYTNVSPIYEPVRSDPRFSRLLAKLGVPS